VRLEPEPVLLGPSGPLPGGLSSAYQ